MEGDGGGFVGFNRKRVMCCCFSSPRLCSFWTICTGRASQAPPLSLRSGSCTSRGFRRCSTLSLKCAPSGRVGLYPRSCLMSSLSCRESNQLYMQDAELALDPTPAAPLPSPPPRSPSQQWRPVGTSRWPVHHHHPVLYPTSVPYAVPVSRPQRQIRSGTGTAAHGMVWYNQPPSAPLCINGAGGNSAPGHLPEAGGKGRGGGGRS